MNEASKLPDLIVKSKKTKLIRFRKTIFCLWISEGAGIPPDTSKSLTDYCFLQPPRGLT
mgnify:CR=1 FL=1